MTITVSGLGSGLDYDTWIEELCAIKQDNIDTVSSEVTTVESQETALSDIEDDYSSLLDAIDTFTNTLSTEDIFNEKTTTTNNSAVTAAATSSATSESISVSVSQLATATVAESSYSISSGIDENTTLDSIDEGAVDEGTFTVYVNGAKNTLTTTTGETVGTLLSSIEALSSDGSISATITNGQISISGDSDTTVSLGASSDTSNLSNLLGFEASTTSTITTTSTGATTTTSVISYTSQNLLTDTNTTTAITNTTFSGSDGSTTTVSTGTFSIGGVSFTISSSTSLDDIIDDINDSDAGVTASWDSNAGKLVLTAEDTGASSIDVEAGTSNFTDVMGLTSSTWTTTEATNSTTGETTTTVAIASTALASSSQTLGNNAKLTINGTSVTSASNKVDSSVSGLTGVTLSLSAVTTTAATVSVSTDTSTLETALTTLVSAINSVIADTDTATDTNGLLYGEQILKTIRNNIRTLITSGVNGISLASLGITTGDIGTSTTTDTNQLTINTTTLESFLSSSDNVTKLATLLRGSTTSSTTYTGILSQISDMVESATDTDSGYFVTKESTYEDKVDRLNNKIDRMTNALESYYSQLEAKFSAMDELISNLESEASVFDSYFASS